MYKHIKVDDCGDRIVFDHPYTLERVSIERPTTCDDTIISIVVIPLSDSKFDVVAYKLKEFGNAFTSGKSEFQVSPV